jgi:hypothetical protein
LTPEAAISALDRQIAQSGQDVTLTFVETGSTAAVPIRAFVRGYQPHELVGGIIQGDTLVVVSPTSLMAADRLPRRNDRVTIAGRVRHIEDVIPIYMGLADQLVRLNIQVRGP